MNDNPFLYDLDVMIIKDIMELENFNLLEVVDYFSGSKDLVSVESQVEEINSNRYLDYNYYIAQLRNEVNNIIR